MKGILPNDVIAAIQKHLVATSDEVQEEVWECAQGDEDTITGDYLGQLRSRERTIEVDGEQYTWSATYKKFRGRGPRAPEKRNGADAIFSVKASDGDRSIQKGVLLQAKKGKGKWGSADLREQVSKMEGVAPNGSLVFNYGPDGFLAAKGTAVLDGTVGDDNELKPAGESLSEVVECKTGLFGLQYDANRERVQYAPMEHQFFIARRLRVHVEVPSLEPLREEALYFVHNARPFRIVYLSPQYEDGENREENE
jgi:hypothetical protein